MDCSKYIDSSLYPNKSDYTKTFYYKEGVCVGAAVRAVAARVGNSDQLMTRDEDSVFDRAAYEKARDVASRRHAALEAQFKRDLFEDLGITGNPRADKLYDVAWKLGHGVDLDKIYSIASDLVKLIT